MPLANRAFASSARRPAVRAAALLWIWLTVVFAPVGATLHAMSHVERFLAVPAVPAGIADAARDGEGTLPERHAGRAPGGEDERQGVHRHGAEAHCHVCDEWQFLDHVLPSAALVSGTESFAAPVAGRLPVTRLAADRPWILPRAPPGRRSDSSA
ncbi:hypothetical protein AKI39_13940 [Bordetella sp. H567]|nr:hypothetical protein AKI39_13940 [Bordetella sp. H567]